MSDTLRLLLARAVAAVPVYDDETDEAYADRLLATTEGAALRAVWDAAVAWGSLPDDHPDWDEEIDRRQAALEGAVHAALALAQEGQG